MVPTNSEMVFSPALACQKKKVPEMKPMSPLVTSNTADSLVKLMEEPWNKSLTIKQLCTSQTATGPVLYVHLCTHMPNDNVVHIIFLFLYFHFKIVTVILAQK